MTKSTLLNTNKKTKDLMSQEHKTFIRLKKKIESLKALEQKQKQALDEALDYYHNKIVPAEMDFAKALIEGVSTAYKFFKKPKTFPKQEKALLKELLLDDIDLIFRMTKTHEVPSEIQKIYKDLTGVKSPMMTSNEFGPVNINIQEIFEDMGIKVDFSKIFESAFEESEEPEWENPPKKTQKEKQLLELESKSLSSIYKGLAKVLHPDLEQDPSKKKEKEEVMKKLTSAYESSDLYTLLSLELEWMDSSTTRRPNAAQMRIFNALLKEQVDTLQDNIDTQIMDMKYYSIQPFYPENFDGLAPLVALRKDLISDCKHTEKFNKAMNVNPVTVIKGAIEDYYDSVGF